ncbi:hypothetical protein [Streptomyces sp. NPDC059850]|uniref:hypothetical protein n=1 Tax=Streptomyces sp. NPDC059850 TaxID=3346970 RepID=UPI0036548B33
MSGPDGIGSPADPGPRRLDIPRGGPLDGAGEAGGARTAREARAHLRLTDGPPRPPGGDEHRPLPEGPVTREELALLRRVYRPAPGYAAMREQLRRTHLLALCGESGTGRTWTGLALLAEATGHGGPADAAEHAGPPLSAELAGLTGSAGPTGLAGPAGLSGSTASTALAGPDGPADSADPAAPAQLAGGGVIRLGVGDLLGLACGGWQPVRGRGYLFELPADDVPDRLGPLLDRLRARFAERGAFGVVLLAGGPVADRLLSARRHAVPYEPPDAAEVLDRHLVDLLADEPAELLVLARATAARPDVADALGLDEPRPGEAARLARQLAAHAEGRLSDEGLLERCRAFAPDQARAWFDGAGRPGTLPAALPALRTAALRIALAVFNGSAHSLTAEAAELLTWELAVTLDPQYAPGRTLFAVRPGAGLAAARAVCGDGVEDLGDASVPVRAVRFQGRRLAAAVLYEAWDGHHNVRGPMARWLRALCDDPRPQVWVRAAVAAGVLCARDYLYGFVELLLPLARADSPVQRMAAATALAEAARDDGVRPAVDGLLRGWALGDDARERETAVLAHGYGLAAGSVQASLEELARLAYEDDGRITSYSVLRLLAGTEPDAVLGVLVHWLHDTRRPRRDLALVTVLRAVTTRTSHLWGLCEVPELEPYAAWPLATALLAARPGSTPLLAELLRAALTWARSAAAAEDALVGWIRQAARDDRQLAVLYGFLPRLAHDGDEPLDVRAATRIREVLEAL